MAAEKELKHFCKNVLYLRKEYGYTQKEMANILGISVSSLRKVEKGMIPRCITAETLYNLCYYFQISDDLIVNESLNI